MTLLLGKDLIERIKIELEKTDHAIIDTGQLKPEIVIPNLKKNFPTYCIEAGNDTTKIGGQIYIYKK